MKDIKSA